jgi:hypothetical protein
VEHPAALSRTNAEIEQQVSGLRRLLQDLPGAAIAREEEGAFSLVTSAAST